MVSRVRETPLAPITNLRVESEATHLLKVASTIPSNRHPIGEIEVKPKEQPHMSLGNFNTANPPKGFTIHIDPDPDPDAIVTQITRLGHDESYELVLHIANYGNKTVSVEVWRT